MTSQGITALLKSANESLAILRRERNETTDEFVSNELTYDIQKLHQSIVQLQITFASYQAAIKSTRKAIGE